MIHNKIGLRDTGYRTVSGLGSCSVVARGDDDVSGGTLTLDVTNFSYTIQSNNNDEVTPNKFENNDHNKIFGLTEVDKIGISVPVWDISGVLNIETTEGKKTFAKLIQMCKTLGVKELTGIPGTASIINYVNYYDDYYADQSKSTANVVDHIHGRIQNFNIPIDANRKEAKWTITFQESG